MNTVLYIKSSVKRSDCAKLDGARDIAQRLGWHLQIVETLPDAAGMTELQDFWKPLGAIVETDGWSGEVDPAAFDGLPTVLLDLEDAAAPKGCFRICQDSYATGREAARELLKSGRNVFAYIPFPGNPHWSLERETGFRKALAVNGKSCTLFADDGAAPDSVAYRKRLQDFLVGLPKPCAIFAANDETAEVVVVAAAHANLRVPEDVSLLGVDNYEPICEQTQPSLSSIEPDFRRGGELAALMLAALIRDGKGFHGSRAQTFGPLRTVRRASTRTTQGRHDAEVAAALELIRREACNGLRAETVMAGFACSRPIAASRFRKATGHTILEEIHAVQLERAKTLLRDPHRLLKSISDFCGFKNPNSLRKFFLKETGMTMSAWRNAYLKSR